MTRNFILLVELSNHSRKKAFKDKMSRNDGVILVMVFIQKEPNTLFRCFYKQVKKITSNIVMKIGQHNLSFHSL